jgi:hypothetical protein
MIAALFGFALAALFLGLGRWGRHNAADLVPTALSAYGRAKRERSLRRGARSCQLLGSLFAVFAVLAVLGSL